MFSDIKVGEFVVQKINTLSRHATYRIVKVDRVKKTLVIVGISKYKRDTGETFPRPSTWKRSTSIYLVTKDMLEKVKLTKVRQKANALSSVDFGKLVTGYPDFIETIYDMVMDKMKELES